MSHKCDRYLRDLGDRKYVDAVFLRKNPDCIFVFGDNLERRGKGGAAELRDEPNTYGFVTKKQPTGDNSAFYHPREYERIYNQEVEKLRMESKNNHNKCYLISKVGAGLANRFGIFEQIIEPRIKSDLGDLQNIVFLW